MGQPPQTSKGRFSGKLICESSLGINHLPSAPMSTFYQQNINKMKMVQLPLLSLNEAFLS